MKVGFNLFAILQADKLVDNQMDTAPAKLAEKSCSLRGSMARQTITTPNTKQVQIIAALGSSPSMSLGSLT